MIRVELTPTDVYQLALANPSKKSNNETFDRFASRQNLSIPFAGIKRVVFPRFCPPDRCSGRPPGSGDDYEKVENCLNLIFDSTLLVVAMRRDDKEGTRYHYRCEFITFLVSSVSTLDWDSELQKSKLRVMLEDTHAAFLATTKLDDSRTTLEILAETFIQVWKRIVSFEIKPLSTNLRRLV